MAGDDFTGRTLDGGIELIDGLGKEGLGQLYLGLDASGNQFRVKVLRKEATVARKRFSRELEAARALSHERILPMVGDGEVEGRPYIVFEHVDGVPLTDHLQKAAPLPPDQAVEITRQVLSVLQAAHAHGVVHRNLTPDNILLVGTGPAPDIRVRDFGLAQLDTAAAEDDQPVTAANVRVGRLTYMAPEYVQTGKATPAVDLYAAGVLLFEMVTGTTPPVATYPLPAPSSERSGVPAYLDEAVRRLTAPEPEERATVEEAVALLKPPRSKTPWIAAVVGVGLLGATGVVILAALIVLWWAVS